jgi:glycosyltransferase involved in cell wall biosynthesis
MRILQLCAVDFTLYHFLLPLMRGLRSAGHEVTGACAHGNLVAKIEAEGFRVIDVPIRRSANPLALWRSYRAILSTLRAEKFDMVHVHTPVAALAGRLAAWRAGVPKIVYTAHGFYFHEHMPWPKRFAHIGLEWLAGRTTDLLLTQAEEDAATARRLSLARGPIHAIGNGSDTARFRPALPLETMRGDIRAQMGTRPDRPVILMVGRLVAEKGYPELVEAMRNVDAELWIVGARLASDHADSVDAAVAAAENDPVLKSRIRLLGYRSDVPDLLRAADIFTLPSYREGMPRSIIEAMLSGLPVVATDIRGSREEVVEGETGVLVPVRDPKALAAALSRLAGDAALRKQLGATGLARARTLYDEAKIVERQIALLESHGNAL